MTFVKLRVLSISRTEKIRRLTRENNATSGIAGTDRFSHVK